MHLVEKEKLEYIYLRWKMERRLSEKENGDKHYMNDRVGGGGGGGREKGTGGSGWSVGWGGVGGGRVGLDGVLTEQLLCPFTSVSLRLPHLRYTTYATI